MRISSRTAGTARRYYYVQNEPQNEADHDLAAHLARSDEDGRAGLRIAVSEEPKPEIAEHPEGSRQATTCGPPDLPHFEPDYAKTRQRRRGPSGGTSCTAIGLSGSDERPGCRRPSSSGGHPASWFLSGKASSRSP